MRYRRVLVVVSGNKSHGKDTLADALAEILPDAGRDAYAAPLKMCVHLKTGIPLEVLNDPSKKEDPNYGAYGQTPRKLMQDEGEEARQRIGLTVWADRLGDRFEIQPKRIMIVSDGRHPKQEITAVKARVSKDTLVLGVLIRRPSVPVVRGHISEDAVADATFDDFDLGLMNDGTREELLSKKVPQLADYIYLRAMGGGKTPAGFIVGCPNGGRQRWPHIEKADALMLARAKCEACGASAHHRVESAAFDGLIIT